MVKLLFSLIGMLSSVSGICLIILPHKLHSHFLPLLKTVKDFESIIVFFEPKDPSPEAHDAIRTSLEVQLESMETLDFLLTSFENSYRSYHTGMEEISSDIEIVSRQADVLSSTLESSLEELPISIELPRVQYMEKRNIQAGVLKVGLGMKIPTGIKTVEKDLFLKEKQSLSLLAESLRSIAEGNNLSSKVSESSQSLSDSELISEKIAVSRAMIAESRESILKQLTQQKAFKVSVSGKDKQDTYSQSMLAIFLCSYTAGILFILLGIFILRVEWLSFRSVERYYYEIEE